MIDPPIPDELEEALVLAKKATLPEAMAADAGIHRRGADWSATLRALNDAPGAGRLGDTKTVERILLAQSIGTAKHVRQLHDAGEPTDMLPEAASVRRRR